MSGLASPPLPLEAAAAIEYARRAPLLTGRRLGQQAPPAVALSAERARAAPAGSLLSWTTRSGLV
jgi:hypothetical protein